MGINLHALWERTSKEHQDQLLAPEGSRITGLGAVRTPSGTSERPLTGSTALYQDQRRSLRRPSFPGVAMIVFAVKVLWFSLSIIGLIGCWTVMMTFGRSAEWIWGPFMYCVTATVLQGIFCLGMIWRMDPFQMPTAFCLAQAYIIGLCSFVLTGACAALSFATTMLVIQFSKGKAVLPKHAFRWRAIYFFPLVVFPLLASALQISLTTVHNAVQPSDDLHCDATRPLSFRFLGYAGIPQLLAIPCFFLSLVSIYRIIKTQQHIRRSMPFTPSHLTPTKKGNVIYVNEPETLTPMPIPHAVARRERIMNASTNILTPLTKSPFSTTFCGDLEAKTEDLHSTHSPHSPQSPNSPRSIEKYGSDYRDDGETFEDVDNQSDYSEVSHDIPRFAPIIDNSDSEGLQSRSDNNDQIRKASDGSVATTASLTWAKPKRSESESERPDTGHSYIGITAVHAGTRSMLESRANMGTEQAHSIDYHSEYADSSACVGARGQDPAREMDVLGRPVPPIFRQSKYDRYPHLSPAILRLLAFQTLFAVTEFLAAISTIIDVASNRQTPTPLGTQHVALLLTVWGPVFLFAYSKVPVILLDDIRRWCRIRPRC